MKTLFLFFASLTLSVSAYCAPFNDQVELPYQLNIKKIKEEKSHVNYTLNEIITIIEDSIRLKKKVVIPENCTEFEKALFTARRIQHNDSQLVAIKFFKTLLEFECYRNRGEELYLKLLLGSSINYIGAPFLAYQQMSGVFPELLTYISDAQTNGFFLGSYARILIRLDSISTAKKVFENSLAHYQQIGNEKSIYNTRNNLAYVCNLLGDYEYAKTLFKQNQQLKYKNLNPVIYAFSFGNYGSVLFKEGNLDSALYYFRKELLLLNEIGTSEGLPSLYKGMGDIFKQKRLSDSAQFYYQLVLMEATKINNIRSIVESHVDLMKLYSINEDTPELSTLIENYLSANDSLREAEKVKDADIEGQVATFLKIVSETEVSRRKYDELENDYKDLTYVLIVLSIITLSLIIILYLRNNNRKKLKTKNIELQKSYQLISESNDKNEVLLKELHHRVKNNLQIISSLFNLQLNASELDEEAQNVFKDAKSRIQSIASVHKRMYQSNQVDLLSFEQYLKDLSKELIKLSSKETIININIERGPISIESAVPLGLIFNELLTNSLKYAGNNKPLEIEIKYEVNDNKERFVYADNGVGFTNSKDVEDNNSIGLSLVELLAKQLEAKVEYIGKNGFELSIEGNFE